MKKTFPLTSSRHAPPRVAAAIKNDVRKYLKRERRKKLPDDAGYWTFDCRVGRDEASAEDAHSAELVPAIDAAAEKGWPEIFIEILARPGKRKSPRKPQGANADDGASLDTPQRPA